MISNQTLVGFRILPEFGQFTPRSRASKPVRYSSPRRKLDIVSVTTGGDSAKVETCFPDNYRMPTDDRRVPGIG